MAKYALTVDFTAEEDAALTAIMAANPDLLTVQAWLERVRDEHMIGQGRQYIEVEARKKMKTMDAGLALSKLNA